MIDTTRPDAEWPARTARRGMSAAGVTLRLRTNSKKLVLSVTFIDSPDAPDNAAVAWERSRPSFFSLYRDGKYVSSVAALTQWTRQDVTIYDDPQISGEAEIQVLFPFYYRNAEIIVHAIGIEPQAALRRPAPDKRPRVLFHGDSITHGPAMKSGGWSPPKERPGAISMLRVMRRACYRHPFIERRTMTRVHLS